MSNTGRPDSVRQDEAEDVIDWRPVILGLLTLAIALLIGSQVIGVVYALLFLPAAPLPAAVTPVSATQEGYGAERQHYYSTDSACAMIDYYRTQGATCVSVAPWCQNVTIAQLPRDYANQPAAVCSNIVPFSIFALQYRVEIRTGNFSEYNTEFYLEREILWNGIPATATPTPFGTPAPTPTMTAPPQFGPNG